jgi:ketosteroid isomerase-like protein
MKPYRVWPILLMAAVTACATQMQSPGTAFRFPSDAAAIRAVLDTSSAGWNRGELPVYLYAYTDSATTMGPTGLVHGVNAIGDQMEKGFWRSGRPIQALQYEHLVIRPLGPDYALVTGQYVLRGGGRPNRTGWFTTVWARTRAGWRMIHDQS